MILPAPELAEFVPDFLDGAYAVYGHTLLERAGEMGLLSSWAKDMFGTDYARANAFLCCARSEFG